MVIEQSLGAKTNNKSTLNISQSPCLNIENEKKKKRVNGMKDFGRTSAEKPDGYGRSLSKSPLKWLFQFPR